MALFRAMSTTKSRRGGYDRLLDETSSSTDRSSDGENNNNNNGKVKDNAMMLKRAISVPARVLFGSSNRKMSKFTTSETSFSTEINYSSSKSSGYSKQHHEKPETKKETKTTLKGGKVHPVFGLFDGRSWRKKKLTANPDFSRYIEYLREGGMWNKNT